jgi:hypothetical protein
MGKNAAKRLALRRGMYHGQGGRCYCCGEPMVWPDCRGANGKNGGPSDEMVCVAFHLDSRLSWERGLARQGQQRKVAVHWKCAQDMSAAIEQSVGTERLHELAGRHGSAS